MNLSWHLRLNFFLCEISALLMQGVWPQNHYNLVFCLNLPILGQFLTIFVKVIKPYAALMWKNSPFLVEKYVLIENQNCQHLEFVYINFPIIGKSLDQFLWNLLRFITPNFSHLNITLPSDFTCTMDSYFTFYMWNEFCRGRTSASGVLTDLHFSSCNSQFDAIWNYEFVIWLEKSM